MSAGLRIVGCVKLADSALGPVLFAEIGIASFNVALSGYFVCTIYTLVTQQVSISQTFYELFLRMQITKVEKKTDNMTVSFALSGSERVRAAWIILLKLTPGVNFTSIIRAASFAFKCFAQLFSTYSLAFVVFCQKSIGATPPHKMLVKLTTGLISNNHNFLWIKLKDFQNYKNCFVLEIVQLFG